MIVAIMGIHLARRRRRVCEETYQEEGVGCECVKEYGSPGKAFKSHEARNECENDTVKHKPFDAGTGK